MPSQLVYAKDGAWSWKGNWKETPDGKASAGPGNEVTLKFKGSAVAVIGPLGQRGGRAKVFVDGKESPYIMDAYIGPDTHDNILWHVHGLPPGEHTLRIVTQAQADARSRGHKICIEKAVRDC